MTSSTWRHQVCTANKQQNQQSVSKFVQQPHSNTATIPQHVALGFLSWDHCGQCAVAPMESCRRIKTLQQFIAVCLKISATEHNLPHEIKKNQVHRQHSETVSNNISPCFFVERVEVPCPWSWRRRWSSLDHSDLSPELGTARHGSARLSTAQHSSRLFQRLEELIKLVAVAQVPKSVQRLAMLSPCSHHASRLTYVEYIADWEKVIICFDPLTHSTLSIPQLHLDSVCFTFANYSCHSRHFTAKFKASALESLLHAARRTTHSA